VGKTTSTGAKTDPASSPVVLCHAAKPIHILAFEDEEGILGTGLGEVVALSVSWLLAASVLSSCASGLSLSFAAKVLPRTSFSLAPLNPQLAVVVLAMPVVAVAQVVYEDAALHAPGLAFVATEDQPGFVVEEDLVVPHHDAAGHRALVLQHRFRCPGRTA